MTMGARLRNRVTRWLRGSALPTWYHPDFRLPITSLAARSGMDPRRADLVAWYLLDTRAIRRHDVHTPWPVPWKDVARVHDLDYLETLTQAETLGRIYGVEAWDVPVDEVLGTVRLSCGATVGAARYVVRHGGPALNLLGGMHHAGRMSGGGFCPINDIAIAIAVLRAEGCTGQIVVLDLDAHPPDGTADCLQDDSDVWIGSLSGADWGPLAGEVDETVLPEGAGDDVYMRALDALLTRMPQAEVAFVLAGGDVLADDPIGPLGLTEDGVLDRDRRVDEVLADTPAVWLSAGGYGETAWRVLANTGLMLSVGRTEPLPSDIDPLREHYAVLSKQFRREDLQGDSWLSEADLAEALGLPGPSQQRLLGFYTAEGIELVLSRYGILDQVRRLGYGPFRCAIDRTGTGDRVRLYGFAQGEEHLLVEEVLETQRLKPNGGDELQVLFVHWLTLRHPLSTFNEGRPQLPGQEVPGLGMARELGELFGRMAMRLKLAGVAVRPAWFHVAYTCRYDFRFVDPLVQGRFEALIRDLDALSLRDATIAVSEGRVSLDGEPYVWESDLMVTWLDKERHAGRGWREKVDAERERVRFRV